MRNGICFILLILCAANGFTDDGFVRINNGTFLIGSPDNEPQRNIEDESPQHQVTLSSFRIGKYPVTQKEYREVTGKNPSHFKGDNLPVEMVSWFDALEYCNIRSQNEGLTPAYTINGKNVIWHKDANGYRLPTEAEWEYACRAGTTTPFNRGLNITTSQANFDGTHPNNIIKGINRGRTTPVGGFSPNAWGLYDMHGNVWEWCWDIFGEYTNENKANPDGSFIGPARVCRGGSWNASARGVRSACRGKDTPDYCDNNMGFRLVLP